MNAFLSSLPFTLQKAANQRSLAAEQILFRQGDLATDLYVVQSGRIQLIRHTLERQTTPIEVVRSGESCGEAVFISGAHSCTAIAEVPSQILAYSGDAVFAALQQSHHFTQQVVAELIRKNRSMKHHLAVRSIRASDQRVLHYLRILVQEKQLISPDRENVVLLDRPLKQVAAELGLSAEAFSRALTRLEQQGLIDRSQRQVTLCSIA